MHHHTKVEKKLVPNVHTQSNRVFFFFVLWDFFILVHFFFLGREGVGGGGGGRLGCCYVKNKNKKITFLFAGSSPLHTDQMRSNNCEVHKSKTSTACQIQSKLTKSLG